MSRRSAFAPRLTALAITAAAVLPLRAEEKPRPRQRSAAATSASSSAPVAGWRAFRDPVTGKLREPTPEEALELSRRAAARKSVAPVAFEVVVHPDGMKSVDLQGAFDMSLVARRNADGSISYECRPATAVGGRRAAQPPAPPEK